MSAIEKLRNRGKATTGGTPEAGPKKSEGLWKERIFNDPDQKELFRQYLQEEGAEDLALKIGAEEVGENDKDWVELDRRAKGFFELMDQKNELGELIATKDFEEVVMSFPGDFGAVGNAVGPEGIRNAIINNLDELALRDRKGFFTLKKSIASMMTEKKTAEASDAQITKICGELGITEDEYIEATKSPDPQAALGALMKGRMGWFKKLDYLGKKGEAKFQSEVAAANKIGVLEKSIAALDRDKISVAKSLRGILFKNASVKKSLNAELLGEDVEVEGEEEMTFAEFKDWKKNIKKLKKEDLLKALKIHNQTMKTKAPPGSKIKTRDELTKLDAENLETFARNYASGMINEEKRHTWLGEIGALFFAKEVMELIKA